MIQIEQDFLTAIQNRNNTFVLRCLTKGLTANIRDEKGNTALEYALQYNNKIFVELAEHPKTTKETLGRALDYIEVQRFYHPAIVAQKKWENEASLIQKVFDIIIGSQALTLASNAAKTYHSLYIKQQFLLNLYQKERN